MIKLNIGNISITPFKSNVRFDKRSTIKVDLESEALSKEIIKKQLQKSLILLDSIILKEKDSKRIEEFKTYRKDAEKELEAVEIVAFSKKHGELHSENINQKIFSIKLLLGKNKVKELFEKIEKLLNSNSKDKINEYLLLRSTYERAKQDHLLGLIKNEEKELIFSRVFLGLLNLLDSLSVEDVID